MNIHNQKYKDYTCYKSLVTLEEWRNEEKLKDPNVVILEDLRWGAITYLGVEVNEYEIN